MKLPNFLRRASGAFVKAEPSLFLAPSDVWQTLDAHDRPWTVSVTADATEKLRKFGLFEVSDLAAIAERSHATCKRLGFLRQETFHCVIDVSATRHPRRDTSMCITRIEPPMTAAAGTAVARAMLIFAPSFETELADFARVAERFADRYCSTNNANKVNAREESAAMVRAKTRTMLAHEMTHLFATDEFSANYGDLSLEQLELLTDAITMETLIDDYAGTFRPAQYGFADGLAYLVDLVNNASNQPVGREEMFASLREQALRIIADPTSVVGQIQIRGR